MNLLSCGTKSGKITATKSGHLRQFLLAHYVVLNPVYNKWNILEREKFNKENFITDYSNRNCFEKLQLEQRNADFSMESYLGNINSILDTYL